MNEQNWTREPLTKEARFGHADGARWVLKSKSTDRVAVVSVGGVGSPEIAQANADRLIDCWNAMLGIPDPAGFVERAKELLDYWKQNRNNFQLEKAEDYFKALDEALETLAKAGE